MLKPDDFKAFFTEVHGYEPFPWQRRLLNQVFDKNGEWPATLDLPTGSGKTAAIDIAIFHLALEASRGEARRAPVRVAFVVDRRLVVDDAFERAKRLAVALNNPVGKATISVARQLKQLAGEGPALVANRLRGGIPREDDWARTPSQPTVLCSTVDQVGSRLLFRGYGISDSMKPVHAGLLGSDCLILLDEAHLAEPFRQTLEWVGTYRSPAWRETTFSAPWGVSLLTATPGEDVRQPFSLDQEDRENPVLVRRLSASKPVRLVGPISSSSKSDSETDGDDEGSEEAPSESGTKDFERRVNALVKEVKNALRHFSGVENGTSTPAIGVVVNRVARARTVFETLQKDLEVIAEGDRAEILLMIGPARAIDRDGLVQRLDVIRTRTWQVDEQRRLGKPIIIVATQCIEAGVDIDLDALITELAPLDALRQRFGRLNRAGREIKPDAAIVSMKADLAARYEDPVYGTTLKNSWMALKEAEKTSSGTFVDFGINNFSLCLTPDTIACKDDAPVLLPAHLDLLSQTSPIPSADPDIALYLHGPRRQPDAVTLVWHADVDPERQSNEQVRRLLTLVPPRSAEAIELPVWTVRDWLQRGNGTNDQLADVAAAEPEEDLSGPKTRARQTFRWKGDDERSLWITDSEVRPGDTVIVPTYYGGVDRFGWNPSYGDERSTRNGEPPIQMVTDVARQAAVPFAERRFAVRVAPGLLSDSVSDDRLAEALATSPSTGWRALRDRLLDLPLPVELVSDLELLNLANARDVVAYQTLYGEDNEGRRRGVVFIAKRGLKSKAQNKGAPSPTDASDSDGAPNSTEDDIVGSMPGFSLQLDTHNRDVGEMAGKFALAAGLSADRKVDLQISGELHDLGKADPRFQSWLHYGDPLGPDPDAPEQLLAKSGRRLPPRAREDSGLPDHWRHEALSVRLASTHARFLEAKDQELVLWLLGVHHGFGRPFFPHCDPTETAPNVGPQSLAFDWRNLDWPSLFAKLKERYGVWELARMEAILRLADHRASEMRASEVDSK